MDLYEVRNEAKGYNEADHAHGGFNWLTWDTLETRSDITKDQLELIIDKLVNTNTICRLIDEEVGVKLGTSRKIYNRQIFAKITEGYVFQYRNNKSVGENSVNAKLNEAQVKEIIERLKIGDPIPKIAKDYGVIRAAIHDIKNGDNWAHLTKRIKFYDYPKVKKILSCRLFINILWTEAIKKSGQIIEKLRVIMEFQPQLLNRLSK